MKLDSLLAVGRVGGSGGVVGAEVLSSTRVLYASIEPGRPWLSEDALWEIAAIFLGVRVVLRGGCLPQIIPAVIGAISVRMVEYRRARASVEEVRYAVSEVSGSPKPDDHISLALYAPRYLTTQSTGHPSEASRLWVIRHMLRNVGGDGLGLRHGPTIESKSVSANPKNSPKAKTMIQSLLSEREVTRFPL